MDLVSRAAGLIPLLLLLTPAAAAAAGPRPPASEAATSAPGSEALRQSVRRHLIALEEGGDEEGRKMLSAALELAGPLATPVLVERLRRTAGTEAGAAAAWALGEVSRPAPGEDAGPREGRTEAVAVLVEALASEEPATRLAAASALGVIEAREAEPALLDLLGEGALPAPVEDVLLMALAGLRGRGLSLLEARLEQGGGQDWSDAVVLSFLRWGGASWPELARLAGESPDPRVRVTALTALLLLAEPASACRLGELYGTEPEPVLRRVVLQALAATRHPLARDQLALVARTETRPLLREAAGLLTEDLRLEAERARKRREASRGPRRSVPELLAGLERRAGFERHVAEVEERADPRHVEDIARLLRRLPLRGDERALTDHARLAQVRARLLCLDGIDCGG